VASVGLSLADDRRFEKRRTVAIGLQHSYSFGFLGARIGTRDRGHYESKRGDGSRFLARDYY
jgi:hypothetical protein